MIARNSYSNANELSPSFLPVYSWVYYSNVLTRKHSFTMIWHTIRYTYRYLIMQQERVWDYSFITMIGAVIITFWISTLKEKRSDSLNFFI